jgi:hypothetical protein
VLTKIDISKAFDSLSWEFLLEVLRRRGFGVIFRYLICDILRSAVTSIMINGERGPPINLARGVRQGDPLSPTLFILAMDTLQAAMRWAVEHGLLADLGLSQAIPRVSIYADDAVLFFRLTVGDLEVISTILKIFADSLGLKINLQRSHTTCIRCDDDTALLVANHFKCIRQDFPIVYLGIPLTMGRLRRTDIWPVIDKFSGKLKGWKPKLLMTGGRFTLTRSVLMALPLLAVLPLPQWAPSGYYQQTLPWFCLEM